MALAAVVFWLPDTLWHAVRRSRFDGVDFICLTALMPSSLLALYLRLKNRTPGKKNEAVGWPLVLGAWVLGGPFMILDASFMGAGLAGPDGLRSGIELMFACVLPMFTIELATYDGSLFALFLVAIAGLVIWIVTVGRTRKWGRR